MDYCDAAVTVSFLEHRHRSRLRRCRLQPYSSLMKPRTAIFAAIPATFSKRLERLTTRGTELRDAGKQWAKMYVQFCRDYTDTYRTAKELDSHTNTTTAADALDDLFEGVSEPVKSKWRTVGAADTAQTLLSPSVLKLLPASTDSIYQLATLPPERLVTIDITPQATVKMVRLETARLSTKKKTVTATVPGHTGAVSVKFDFDNTKRGATMKTIAKSVHRALSENPEISVRIEDSRDRDAIKAAMGVRKWESIAERLGS